MISIYRSKIDIWLMAVLFVPIVWTIVESFQTAKYGETAVVLMVFALVVILLLQIKYVIKNNVLIVKTGFLGSKHINIKEIHSVSKTFNPLSAPALSLNRLEIKYGSNYDYILISPRQREKFICELTSINPGINVKV